MAKLISVVVPVYCEEAVLAQTYRELTDVMRSLDAYGYELIFVDDGSTDGSGQYLSRMHDEVRGRPLYVVRDELNVTDEARDEAAEPARLGPPG